MKFQLKQPVKVKETDYSGTVQRWSENTKRYFLHYTNAQGSKFQGWFDEDQLVDSDEQ